MAVPTVYAKLIEFFHKNADPKTGTFSGKSFEEIRDVCRREVRLMVSGSAALPQVNKFLKGHCLALLNLCLIKKCHHLSESCIDLRTSLFNF